MTDTPELDKMREVREESQSIGEFIDWLSTKEMWIGQYVDVGYLDSIGMPIDMSIEQLLADYYGIDLKIVEQERRAVLSMIRGTDD